MKKEEDEMEGNEKCNDAFLTLITLPQRENSCG
jgi:hypothetical protein